MYYEIVSPKCQEDNTHEILPKWLPNNKDTNRHGNSEEKKKSHKASTLHKELKATMEG